jgi:TctA family transporter
MLAFGMLSPMTLVFFLLVLVFVFVIVPTHILWIWVLVDCLRNEPSQGNNKLAWALIIFFASFPGALVYLILCRPQRIREAGR